MNTILVQEPEKHILCLIKVVGIVFIMQDQRRNVQIPSCGECKVVPLNVPKNVCMTRNFFNLIKNISIDLAISLLVIEFSTQLLTEGTKALTRSGVHFKLVSFVLFQKFLVFQVKARYNIIKWISDKMNSF